MCLITGLCIKYTLIFFKNMMTTKASSRSFCTTICLSSYSVIEWLPTFYFMTLELQPGVDNGVLVASFFLAISSVLRIVFSTRLARFAVRQKSKRVLFLYCTRTAIAVLVVAAVLAENIHFSMLIVASMHLALIADQYLSFDARYLLEKNDFDLQRFSIAFNFTKRGGVTAVSAVAVYSALNSAVDALLLSVLLLWISGCLGVMLYSDYINQDEKLDEKIPTVKNTLNVEVMDKFVSLAYTNVVLNLCWGSFSLIVSKLIATHPSLDVYGLNPLSIYFVAFLLSSAVFYKLTKLREWLLASSTVVLFAVTNSITYLLYVFLDEQTPFWFLIPIIGGIAYFLTVTTLNVAISSTVKGNSQEFLYSRLESFTRAAFLSSVFLTSALIEYFSSVYIVIGILFLLSMTGFIIKRWILELSMNFIERIFNANDRCPK